MSVFTDQKYVYLLSNKLDRFATKNQYLWNFRCPLCGDSQKKKTKARAYIYRKKSNLNFLCHNCGHSCSFASFLKILDPFLYQEYVLERYKNESTSNVKAPYFSIAKGLPIFKKQINLPTIESLASTHSAHKYVSGRKIPQKYWSEIYYADNFKDFITQTFSEHDTTKLIEDARIVLPFYDRNMKLLGVQGRSIGKSAVRYITIKQNEDCQKIFGLNRLDLTQKIYVLEGPIDSLFLPNAVATMDANLSSITQTFKDNIVLVFDNEPRNKDVLKQMNRAIAQKLPVCIWPSNMEQKDINDMILSGLTTEQIQYIVDQNTFSDLKAQLQFNVWRKV